MRWIAIPLLACITLQAVPVAAQELPVVPEFKLEAIPSGEDRFVALAQGAAAPFAGQLFDTPTALRWANYLEQYRTQISLRDKAYQQLLLEDQRYCQRVVAAKDKEASTVQVDLTRRLKRVEDKNAELQYKVDHPAWYNTREFGLVTGIVLMVGGAVAWNVAF